MIVTLSPTEASELLAREDVHVVDVRETDEWSRGHVPQAQPIPLEQLRADPERALRRDRALVFICAKGVRSLTAAKLAERLGFDRIFNVDGGTLAWSKAGLPLVTASAHAA